MKIRCNQNHDYYMNYHDYRSGCRCPQCYKENKLITKYEAQKYLNSYGYKLIGEYKNTQEKITIECPNNHVIEMAFCQFKSNGHRCKFCVNNNIKNDYEYIKDTFEEYGYTLIDEEYKNNTQKLNLICPEGHEIKMSWTLFKMGVRCQQCNCSSGESEIVKILKDNKIAFEQQYTFKDCRDKKVLPFDFYLPNYNVCIEFDGEQHYKPFDIFGGEDGFKKRQKHDEIKNEYCNKNHITLIRIPYWDFNNIDKIINKYILYNKQE